MDKEMIIIQLDSEQLFAIVQKAVTKAIVDSQQSSTSSNLPDELLTVKQAADFLSLSIPTVYGLVSKRELPVYKQSKRLYFSKEELIQWIKSGRKKTNKEIAIEADRYLSKTKQKKIV